MEKTLTQSSAPVRETVGMRRWLRLTARKSVATKAVAVKSDNPAADAAASALAELLKEPRRLA